METEVKNFDQAKTSSSESSEQELLAEFEEDFGKEAIQALHEIGCDTARAVLELNADELVSRTKEVIDEELAKKIMDMIRYEFEEEG